MKKLLLFILLLSSTIKSQIDSTKQNFKAGIGLTSVVYALNIPKTQVFYQPTPYTNINLHLETKRVVDYGMSKKAGYTSLLILGIGFISTSILTNSYAYGNYQNGQYTVPPFWQQTPRVVILCLGIGLTTTGTIGLINNK